MLHGDAWGVCVGMHCAWRCILHEDVHGACKGMHPAMGCMGSVHRDSPRSGSVHGERAQRYTLPEDAQGACMAMYCSRRRIQHLFLPNFMQLVTAQPSNSSRPLCKTSPPLRQSTASPNSVSPSALLRVCSSPVCSSLMNT